MHPDGLARAKQLADPGCCIFCEEPLTGIRRFICGRAACRRAYNTSYKLDQRAVRPDLPPKPRLERITWHCGCGQVYTSNEYFRRFHRKRCLFAKLAWPLVVLPGKAAA